jgi:hypothetical protein
MWREFRERLYYNLGLVGGGGNFSVHYLCELLGPSSFVTTLSSPPLRRNRTKPTHINQHQPTQTTNSPVPACGTPTATRARSAPRRAGAGSSTTPRAPGAASASARAPRRPRRRARRRQAPGARPGRAAACRMWRKPVGSSGSWTRRRAICSSGGRPSRGGGGLSPTATWGRGSAHRLWLSFV